MLNALVLCTGNSARSILGEGLFRHLGAGRITGFSAGSQPTGTPNPFAIATLHRHGIAADFAASKSWDVFAGANAPQMSYIFTVCDSAAAETCPFWPGHPAQFHWGLPDPAGVAGDDAAKQAAFEETFQRLKLRVEAFLKLPFDSADPASLRPDIEAIARID